MEQRSMCRNDLPDLAETKRMPLLERIRCEVCYSKFNANNFIIKKLVHYNLVRCPHCGTKYVWKWDVWRYRRLIKKDKINDWNGFVNTW